MPLAAIALAVAAYPRLGGAGRAAISVVLGFFGIVVGIEAVHYTTKVGPSGDDFSGLLAIPAGIALLGLGLVTLWRTRKRDDGPLRTSLRRLAIGAASLLVLVFVLLPLGYAHVGTHAARPPVADIDLGALQSRTSSSTRATGSPWRARTCRRRTARP